MRNFFYSLRFSFYLKKKKVRRENKKSFAGLLTRDMWKRKISFLYGQYELFMLSLVDLDSIVNKVYIVEKNSDRKRIRK